MRVHNKLLTVLVAVFLSFALVACGLQPSQAVVAVAGPAPSGDSAPASTVQNTGTAKELVILHTNDTHGRVVSAEKIVGFSAVSALKKQYAQNPERIVLLVDAGDTLHGTPFATLDKGESIVNLMNRAGYDVMTPGNHDFNYGFDHLRALAAKMDFPLISANVLDKTSAKAALKDSILLNKGGVKIGLFGLTSPETSYKTNPLNVASLAFADPVASAEAAVKSLREQGAQVIIAIAHIGLDEATDITSDVIAQKVAGIDLIIDGHSHTTLENGKKVGSTTLVSTGEYMGAVGISSMNLSTKVVDARLLHADAEQIKAAKDSAVDELVEKITTAQAEILSHVVAKTDVHLEGERENARTRETNLGNLLTDAMRDATGAAIAFTNGGGIRASIAAGDVTKGHIVTVLPFGNYVVTKEITGEALIKALEHGVSKAPEANGGFLHVSGITFSYNASKPAGQRVADVLVNGAAIDSSKKYLVATNDFLAAGGDGYDILGDFPTTNEYGALDEILAGYMAKLNAKGTINYPPNEGRITASGGIIYTVLLNDFLAGIAQKQYGDASKWKEIYEANSDLIEDPNIIYVGWQLKLP